MQVLRYIRFICIFLLNKQIRTHQTHSRQIYKMCGQTGWQAAWVCCRWWLQKQVCVYVCVRHCFDGVMARLWQRDQRNGCQPKVNVLCTWNGRPEAKSAKKKQAWWHRRGKWWQLQCTTTPLTEKKGCKEKKGKWGQRAERVQQEDGEEKTMRGRTEKHWREEEEMNGKDEEGGVKGLREDCACLNNWNNYL